MERLQKRIANNSEYSRRKAEELILEGKVKVNGKIITELGYKVDYSDEIEIDNEVLYFHEKVYYLINKPQNVICSRSDEKHRKTVIDLINEQEKIYPVGRLDYNTTGLLLLTNDGELANGLMHPNHKIPKKYVAKVKGKISKQKLRLLNEGIELDGKKTLPAKTKIIKYNPKKETGIIEIIIYEGRNHQVKNMFNAIGAKVIKLQRTEYAFLDIINMSQGEYRNLKAKEIKKLYGLIQ